MNTAFDRGVDMAIALSSIPDLMTHNTGVSVSGRWLLLPKEHRSVVSRKAPISMRDTSPSIQRADKARYVALSSSAVWVDLRLLRPRPRLLLRTLLVGLALDEELPPRPLL